MCMNLDFLMSNPSFLSHLERCQNAEDIIALFNENGVALTAENITAINHMFDIDKELDAQEMLSVSGGSIITDTVAALVDRLLRQLKHGGGVGKHF